MGAEYKALLWSESKGSVVDPKGSDLVESSRILGGVGKPVGADKAPKKSILWDVVKEGAEDGGEVKGSQQGRVGEANRKRPSRGSQSNRSRRVGRKRRTRGKTIK